MIDAEELFERYLNLEDAEDYGCVGKYNDDVEELLISFANEINSMVCENCKHIEHIGSFSGSYMVCTNVKSELFDFNAPKDYGCNKFERKTHIDT